MPYRGLDLDDMADYDEEKGKEIHYPFVWRTPEHPPKLNLDPPKDPRDSHSVAETISDAATRILDFHQASSFGIHNDTAPSQHPPDSMKIPTEFAKRA
jgi:hypothetical protein